MSIRVIYPQGMAAKDWCNAMSLALADIGQLPVIAADSQWWQWAQVASSQIGLAQYTPPPPNRCVEWRPWADRFVLALSSVGV